MTARPRLLPSSPRIPHLSRAALLCAVALALPPALAQQTLALASVITQPQAEDAPGHEHCASSQLASRALARINELRAMGGSCRSRGQFAPAPALAWNPLLAQAAGAHSRDMSVRNYFAHVGTDGRAANQRVQAAGYTWRGLGENIAAGQADLGEVLEGWMHSDTHCAQLLNPRYTEAALACVPGRPGNAYRSYWTLELARSR